MRRVQSTLFTLALVALSAWGDKKTPPVWKSAKVLDTQAVKTRFGAADTGAAIPTIRDTQLMLLSDEFAYVVEDTRVSGKTSLVGVTERAISNRHHGCRFIVGDDIQFWQEKAFLHVRDADNKECKIEVTRQERLPQPVPPPSATPPAKQ